MPNITLKGVPVKLYRELKRRAAEERRSLNAEAIRRLEESVAGTIDPARDPEAFIARVRERALKYNIKPLSAKEIRDAINEGRE